MTMNNSAENPCNACGPDTDVKCPTCLSNELADLQNDVESLRREFDGVDFEDIQTERDVERSIEEALEQFGRDNEFLTEDDVERIVERSVQEQRFEDVFADGQAFSNLEDEVNDLKAQVDAMQTMIETLHARTLRARYARFVRSVRALPFYVRVQHVLRSR
jgi:hypothetical protein